MEWSRPELIVLGRGAAEESVLCLCKTKPKSFCGEGPCSKKYGYGSNCYFKPNYNHGNS